MDATSVIATIALVVSIVALLKMLEIGKQVDSDAKYYEWWNRSLENRKADKQEEVLEED